MSFMPQKLTEVPKTQNKTSLVQNSQNLQISDSHEPTLQKPHKKAISKKL
jgi:hypothetical protein